MLLGFGATGGENILKYIMYAIFKATTGVQKLASGEDLRNPKPSFPGPSRASSGPRAINSTGPCVGVAAQGQEGL